MIFEFINYLVNGASTSVFFQKADLFITAFKKKGSTLVESSIQIHPS